jgi:hypothetical protein
MESILPFFRVNRGIIMPLMSLDIELGSILTSRGMLFLEKIKVAFKQSYVILIMS